MKTEITKRKVFENFGRVCRDQRAWEGACCNQCKDSFRKVYVDQEALDPDEEYLRQWLLANGAEESDGYVFIAISW